MPTELWVLVIFGFSGVSFLIGRHMGACLTIRLFEERLGRGRYLPDYRSFDVSSENKVGYWDNGYFISDDPESVVEAINANEPS